jgi:hypothetical protein
MSSLRTVSFDEAWKEFLIMREIPYSLQFNLQTDSDNRVVGIGIPFFDERNINGQDFYIDEKTITGFTIAYPKDATISDLSEKLFKPLLGRRLDKSRADSLKKFGETIKREAETRLGAQVRNEIERLISEGNCWEALFSLHPIIEHRLRTMLKYKCMDTNPASPEIMVDDSKDNVCKDIKNFKHLVDITFLTGAIDADVRVRVLSFDDERDTIAHNLSREKILSGRLESLCKTGLELLNILEESFSRIVPKPAVIRMKGLRFSPIPDGLVED